MRQSKKAGDMFEELIIGNYDLLQQAEYNEILLPDQVQQLLYSQRIERNTIK